MDELESADAGDSVCIRTCRDNMESNMVRSVLADAGIRCFVQGEHHRAMLGFMGPYIDLRVLVAQHDAARATAILSALDQATPELATSDAEGAADLAAPSENLVFRTQPRRRPPSPVPPLAALVCGGYLLYAGSLGLGAGMCVLGIALFFGNRFVVKSAARGGRCSTPSCQQFISAVAETCPGCGGKVAGVIEHADQRLSALEELRRSKARSPSPNPS